MIPITAEHEDKTLSFSFAKRQGVLAIADHPRVKIRYRGECSTRTVAELQRFFEKPLVMEKISDEDFSHQLTQFYERDHEATQKIVDDMDAGSDLHTHFSSADDLLESESDAPMIRLLNAVLRHAIQQSASDIHMEVYDDRLLVRFRIDGILKEIIEPPRRLAPLIASRIKIMAKLNIAEKRLPQDGRMALHIAGRSIDVRVSTLPANHGERIVLRLLDKKTAPLDLSALGMAPFALKALTRLMRQPHGILLVTGPTGSGKTTTLYAVLSALNESSRNILTVEDPIEYDLPGVGQTQVNYKVDMTFAKGLRAMLRQDPDIVMVGEIRDAETAEIAVQASLTGHLVLSTLHTNSAVGAITRLRDRGIAPFLLSSSLMGVVAQRLVRRLCDHCKHAYRADPAACALLGPVGDTSPTLYRAQGCGQCEGTGYKGRTGIYEVLALNDTLRIMIHDDVGQQKIERYARDFLISLRQDGCRRVLMGDTTVEEVLRVTTAVSDGDI